MPASSVISRGEQRLHVALLGFILLSGLWLRWQLNGTWRLGPDEALYATWARRITDGSDVWLAKTPGVDKPPLFIYTMALSMAIYGYTEFATRFPNIIVSTIAVLLTYMLACNLYYRQSIALAAALLMALSPFAILYAPTAYPDPMMVMWLLLSAFLASHQRWVMAGLATGLAILTKQEALVLLPMAFILSFNAVLVRHKNNRSLVQAGAICFLRGWLITLAIAVIIAGGLEVAWESARPDQPSPFVLGLTHYGGIGLVSVTQIGSRLVAWWQEALRYVFVSPLLNLVLLVGMPLLLVMRTPLCRVDMVLVAAIVYTLLTRTVVSFQIWNRYMLIVVPLLCILLARLADWVWGYRLRELTPSLSWILLCILITALILWPVREAVAGHVPVGSDHGKYWGIDETARFIRENVPPGSVIFHRSLGWQLGYYLYGAPFDFWWYPSLAWLAQTAAVRAEHSQYIVIPSWENTEDAKEIDKALAKYGMMLLSVHTAHRPDSSISFQTYRISPAYER